MAETQAITCQASILGSRGGVLAVLHYALQEAQKTPPTQAKRYTVAACSTPELGTLLCLGIIAGMATTLPT